MFKLGEVGQVKEVLALKHRKQHKNNKFIGKYI
jgi:hypothetical protein